MSFYTSVIPYGSKILLRGYDEGRQIHKKLDYEPTLFISSRKGTQDSEWKTLDGTTVYPIQPGSMRDCKEFIKQYEDVEGFSVFGHQKYEFQFISDKWTKDVKYDVSLIRVFSIDIETEVEHGFPKVSSPTEKINLITIYDSKSKRYRTWGTKPCDRPGFTMCEDEEEMFLRVQKFWVDNYPDIVTGWNSNYFDIPYMMARMTRVMSEDFIKQFSPWGLISESTQAIMDREVVTYTLSGITQLDYLDLYKKYTYGNQESYKLDHIAFVELGERKLENPGKDFKDFYTNYWDTFVEYNQHDVRLVVMLEDKMRLVELAIAIAYMAKINFSDVFSPIKTWENVIYNHLKAKHIVPPNKKVSSRGVFEGAYVKEPLVGKHKWVASFDLQSLYPHLIMNYNLSPETITGNQIYSTVEDLLAQKIDTGFLKEENLTMTANGYTYRKDILGFFPELMKELYSRRSKDKKLMLKAEQDYQDTHNESLTKEIAKLNNAQMAAKILLNSLYGSLGNNYFLYYDVRQAEGITLSGQLAIRWVANKINALLNKTLGTNTDYVIYSDTDSMYLDLETIVESNCEGKTTEQKIAYMDKVCEKILKPAINKAYDELADYVNAYENAMVMKREVLSDVAIFTGKKRYIMSVHNSEGVQYAEPKIKVVGLEMVRSSTPQVIRDISYDSLPVILHGNKESLYDFINDFRTKYNEFSVTQISMPRGVQGLAKYTGSPIYSKGCPIHVRAALVYNYHVKRLGLENKYPLIRENDKIKFVYVRMPNPFQENIIGFIDELPPEFELNRFIDYDLMFEKTFLDGIDTIVKPMGWSAYQTSSLEDFFG